MKRVAYIFLFFLILFIAAFFSDKYLGNKHAANKAINANWVWQMNNVNVDYIVMGSSRVKSGFDVVRVDSILNTNGLNLGEHGIGIVEQGLLINRYFSKNKAKYLFLQVDYASQNSEDFPYPFHYYNYFPYMGDSVVDNTICGNIGVAKYLFWKYVPLYKYAEFNTEYIHELFLDKIKIKTDSKGFEAIPEDNRSGVLNPFGANKGKKSVATGKQYFENFRYNLKDSVSLHKLLTIATSNDVKVIMYTSPENVDNSDEYEQKVVPGMIKYYKAIGAKYGIPYFHFFGSDFSNNRQNISGDGLHLTYESIKVFTPMLSDSLKKYMK